MYINQFIKTCFLQKIVYLIDTFLGRLYSKPKINKPFPSFCFDIYFKINLVLSVEFNVINAKCLQMKNLKHKFEYCNVNIFQLINFCNYTIPNYQLCNTLSLQKNIEPHVLLYSILQFIWQELAITCKNFISRNIH